MLEEQLRFLKSNLVFLKGLLRTAADIFHHVFCIVLDVAQNFSHGVTFDDMLNLVTFWGHADMNGIGISKEIVQIAHNFLISTP